MAEEIFIQLGLILFVAFIVSYIAKLFKQPIIIGYIVAGIIIGPFVVLAGLSHDVINILSEFGIAFLLFIVGLHMNPKVVKEVGVSSLFIGLVQMAFTFAIGFFVSINLLGFDLVASIYVGIALSFSSTIIVMKLLSDKRQLDSLFGKISIGILIIQDLVAIVVLMFISSINDGGNFSSLAVRGLLTGGGLILSLFFIGYLILPKVTRSIAKNQELLFLFSICWCFIIAALFVYFGFSMEIGALMAGVVLSISPYSTEISSKIRPLRDFFLVLFFIILGLNIDITAIRSIIPAAVVLSLIALLLKPLILMILMMFFNYTKRTNFQVGTTLAQISEFSLIVLALGFAMGHIDAEILSTITLTAVITIALSSYMIMYSNRFYKKLKWFAKIFERKRIKKERKIKRSYNSILFGYNRIGFSILQSLKRIKKSYLVVDFNPDTIANLSKLRVPSLYGDVYDTDLLEELPLDKIELAVSTIPDFDTNILMIKTIRGINPDAIIIARAHTIKDALELYKHGASYVLTPHFLGGEYVANMIKDDKFSIKSYEEEKSKHIRMLNKIITKGHEHPEVSVD